MAETEAEGNARATITAEQSVTDGERLSRRIALLEREVRAMRPLMRAVQALRTDPVSRRLLLGWAQSKQQRQTGGVMSDLIHVIFDG